jgi:Mg2+/Co2+ transporter CorB
MHGVPAGAAATGLDLWLDVLFVVCCITVSAFFSAAETALTAVSRAQIHGMEKAGNRRAALVTRLLDIRERFIGAILLGNNVANVGASALSTSALLALVGERGVLYATALMTVLLLVFAEVLPKTIAINYPERASLFLAPMVSVTVAVFGPVLKAVEVVVQAILRVFGVTLEEQRSMLTGVEELKSAVELLHEEGEVERADRDMVGGLLDLHELAVQDAMVHRTKIRAINADLPAAEVVHAVLASPHTRLPLWRGRPDNIIGILHAKELLRALSAVAGDASRLDVAALAYEPWFVPANTRLQDQLQAFLRRKSHFAIVVDEYGEVMGLVTLEDILEEIVGDIRDEHDLAAQGLRLHPDGSLTVEGSVPIRDLNRVMNWELPDEEANTIAGLVIHEAQTIPDVGQVFIFHGFRFEVLRKVRNLLTLLRVSPVVPADGRDAG